jgi:hypothetical protein
MTAVLDVAPPGRGRAARLLGWVLRLEVLAVLVALVPVATAIARALISHWIPMGDNALVEMRSRDVFSLDHFPLLGTWSSASLSAGKDLNHPGPLLFDLLAPFTAVFGGPAGVAIGIGLLNGASIIGCALVGWRVMGRTGALAATLVAGALAWTLGSVLLTDPWNPHPLVLACLLMLLLTWAVASGDLVLLPWLFAVASLCLQVHLGYAYLVPSLCIAALAGLAVVMRRRWRLDLVARAGDSRRLVGSGAWTLAVLLVLWAQPLYEQLFGSGEGNLSRILSSTGGDEPTIGVPLAVRLVSTVTALPPWWGRSSFTGSIVYTPFDPDGATVSPTDLPSFGVSVAALVALGALLTVLAMLAWRRRDRPVAVAVVVVAVALVVAVLSLAISPFGPLGLTPHQMRWLWSIAAFVTWVVLVGVLRAVAHRRKVASVGDAALALLIAAAAVAAVPFYAQAAGPATFQDQLPTGRMLADQLETYRPAGSVVVIASDLRFTESYSTVVMSVLQREGVDFRVVEEGLVRQLGEARRADGNEEVEIRLAEGRAALDQRDGAERIALAGPLTPAEVDELLAGEAAMIEAVAAGRVMVSTEGAGMIATGRFGLSNDEVEAAMSDPVEFVHGGLAAEMVAAGALTVDDAERAQFVRTTELRRQVGITTVAVYAMPLAGAPTNG